MKRGEGQSNHYPGGVVVSSRSICAELGRPTVMP
jgi:hypothetical protein